MEARVTIVKFIVDCDDSTHKNIQRTPSKWGKNNKKRLWKPMLRREQHLKECETTRISVLRD